MNSKTHNPVFNRFNAGIFAILGLIVYLICWVQKGWGEIAQSLCVFYAMATGFFFLIQLYGFVISQTKYSEDIEAPKFDMLENEEKQWRSYPTR
jgi:hypothetical protein